MSFSADAGGEAIHDVRDRQVLLLPSGKLLLAPARDSAAKLPSLCSQAILQSSATDAPPVFAAAGPHIGVDLAAQAFFVTDPLPELVNEPAELERGRYALAIG